MRYMVLAACLALLASAGAEAATLTGKVVVRNPDDTFPDDITGFSVQVTRPNGAVLFTSRAQTLAAKGKKAVDFTVPVDTLDLRGAAEITITFRATGRVPTRLENAAGNQDQNVVVVLPTEEEMRNAYPPVLEAPPCDCEPCAPPKKHGGLFSHFRGR